MVSAITRSAPSSAASSTAASGGSSASIFRPSTTTSSAHPASSISPATRRTAKPSSPSAHAHLRASTDTPSFPPKRYDNTTACGAMEGDDRRASKSDRDRAPELPYGDREQRD